MNYIEAHQQILSHYLIIDPWGLLFLYGIPVLFFIFLLINLDKGKTDAAFYFKTLIIVIGSLGIFFSTFIIMTPDQAKGTFELRNVEYKVGNEYFTEKTRCISEVLGKSICDKGGEVLEVELWKSYQYTYVDMYEKPGASVNCYSNFRTRDKVCYKNGIKIMVKSFKKIW